ncbi:MAG: DUF1003 domain-containing protein [Candidatus Moraniibacteriota bacterium]
MTNEETKPPRWQKRSANVEYEEQLNRVDRFAVWITEKVGTIGFFLIIFVWTLSWLSWNVFAPDRFQFDPFPAFVLWLFISNMLQIFLMPLIMVGQNLQSKHAEVRAEMDFRVNQKAEQENEQILKMLGEQKKILEEIAKR